MGRRNRPSQSDAADEIDADDASLFHEAVGPVRRIRESPEPPRAPRPAPSTRMAKRDDEEARGEFARMLSERKLAADAIETGDALSYRRDEVPARVLQRLGRGLYAAQDDLDLHGCDAAAAERLLREFLREAVRAGMGCVRIVHGKGLGSGTGVPVLKNLVDRLLRQRSDVLAFHSAPAAGGGTGAVLALLRRA